MLFVKVYNKDGQILKRLFFDIQDTVNRPNNSERYEILDTYLLYYYGTDNYDCEDMEEIVEIEWYEERIKYKDYTVIKKDWRFIKPSVINSQHREQK